MQPTYTFFRELLQLILLPTKVQQTQSAETTHRAASLSLTKQLLSLFDDSSSLSLPACLHCTGHYITDIRWFKQYPPPPPPPLSSPPSLFTPLITVSTGALLSLGLLFCQRHTLQCSLCVPDNCTLFFLNILHVIAQAVRSNQSPGQKGKCRRRTCKLISLKVPKTELCVLDIS